MLGLLVGTLPLDFEPMVYSYPVDEFSAVYELCVLYSEEVALAEDVDDPEELKVAVAPCELDCRGKPERPGEPEWPDDLEVPPERGKPGELEGMLVEA